MDKLYSYLLWHLVVLSMLMCHFLVVAQPSPQNVAMITAFKQGPGGRNCASISVIKLAIGRYGQDKVLKQVDSLATEYRVILQDDSSLVLTKEEVATASRLDRFKLLANSGKSIYKTAKFLYAVMAKKKFLAASRINSAKYRTISDVIEIGGILVEDTAGNFSFLGLERNFDTLAVADTGSKEAVIVTNLYHSAYRAKGSYDEYGTVASFNSFCQHRRIYQRCQKFGIDTCYYLR